MTMTGQCLCGAVRFTAGDVPHQIGACHCGQCRRWASGPYFAVRAGSVAFEGEENIGRYRSSDWAERGFCIRCGSSLFWREKGTERDWAVSVGALDATNDGGHGLRITEHIWIDDKPDFYDFADDAPRLTAAQAMARGD